jgi:hypothetical protein
MDYRCAIRSNQTGLGEITYLSCVIGALAAWLFAENFSCFIAKQR